MALKQFLDNHKKIIILIVVFIVSLFIYRYFWEKKNILVDINLVDSDKISSNRKKLGELELSSIDISKLLKNDVPDDTQDKFDKLKKCICEQK